MGEINESNNTVINDAIFDFAYEIALNDLYWRGGDNQGLKDKVTKTDAIKNAINGFANSVVDGNANKESTLNTIQYISEKVSIAETNEQHLTFGNAQKLVNMTLKYLYMGYYRDKRENFRFCHVPMDSIMLSLVLSKMPDGDKKNEVRKITSWAKLSSSDEAKYQTFQEAIEELIQGTKYFPIDFDLLFWSDAKYAKAEFEALPSGKKVGNLENYLNEHVDISILENKEAH